MIFKGLFDEANNTIFFGRWQSDFKIQLLFDFLNFDVICFKS